MSYQIEMVNDKTKKCLDLVYPVSLIGANYQVGREQKCSLSVTYNYAKYYYKHICADQGIRKLYGMLAGETIDILEHAISNLDDDVSDDYWEATEGNAKMALMQLLTLAKLHPYAIWSGD